MSQAPGSASHRRASLQRAMKVHTLGRGCPVQAAQPGGPSRGMDRLDADHAASFEEGFEAFAPKRLDHREVYRITLRDNQPEIHNNRQPLRSNDHRPNVRPTPDAPAAP